MRVNFLYYFLKNYENIENYITYNIVTGVETLLRFYDSYCYELGISDIVVSTAVNQILCKSMIRKPYVCRDENTVI